MTVTTGRLRRTASVHHEFIYLCFTSKNRRSAPWSPAPPLLLKHTWNNRMWCVKYAVVKGLEQHTDFISDSHSCFHVHHESVLLQQIPRVFENCTVWNLEQPHVANVSCEQVLLLISGFIVDVTAVNSHWFTKQSWRTVLQGQSMSSTSPQIHPFLVSQRSFLFKLLVLRLYISFVDTMRECADRVSVLHLCRHFAETCSFSQGWEGLLWIQ